MPSLDPANGPGEGFKTPKHGVYDRAVVMGDDEGKDPDRTPKRDGDHGANTYAREEGRLPALLAALQKIGHKIAHPCRVLQP